MIAPQRTRRILIGLGNPERGDDAAGRAVVQRLRGMLPEDVELAEEDGEATKLLSRLEGATVTFLIDACASGAGAGTVLRFDAAAGPLPQRAFSLSTHGFGLADAIELARALGQLPPCCIVYTIEGASFKDGAPLTPAVDRAVTDVAKRLYAEIVGKERTE